MLQQNELLMHIHKKGVHIQEHRNDWKHLPNSSTTAPLRHQLTCTMCLTLFCPNGEHFWSNVSSSDRRSPSPSIFMRFVIVFYFNYVSAYHLLRFGNVGQSTHAHNYLASSIAMAGQEFLRFATASCHNNNSNNTNNNNNNNTTNNKLFIISLL